MYSFYNDPSWGNGGYLAWDVPAVFLPFIPGSWAGKAGRYLSKADDFAGITNVVKWNKGSFANSIDSLQSHF